MAKPTEDWKITLRRAALCYPHPVAASAAQVLRSRTSQESIDACLKAAEILVRYLAAVTLASYRGREEANADKDAFGDAVQGPLAFGTFLTLVQTGAKLLCKHPAATYLTPFRPKKDGRPGKADSAITSLLELRNRLGHNLATLSEARARAVLANDQPQAKLAEALSSLEGALSCPLFIIEDQQLARGRIQARMLWLMGESHDPEPMEMVLKDGVHELRTPYVACGNTVIRLWPCLVWGILTERESYGLLIMDTIKDGEIICQALDGWKLKINGESVRYFRNTFNGKSDVAERIVVVDGETLYQSWHREKQLRVEAAERTKGAMPWPDFDPETLRWYALHLSGEASETPETVISKRLFDDRTSFFENEITQARLLFGTEAAVRRTINRDMIDIRMCRQNSVRWEERHIGCENLLTSLRSAVNYFSRHVDLEDASMEGLTKTEGSADYLAMREALVNLFIHQDYTDSSAAAQVELQSERVTFFNTGFSLVGREQLDHGGRSQARNPLIARALRLIGFAELAGSGIRALQDAWRQERRRPPRFESDREANTFTVVLDWRPVETRYDAVWKARLGVRLTPEHIQMLNISLVPEGASNDEIASGTGLHIDEVSEALRYLQVQGLLDERDKRYFVQEHIKELLK